MIGGLSREMVAAAVRPKAPSMYIDAFDALSPRWQSLAGTLAVNGGALRAATLGDWGANVITNGEFTTNTTGWDQIAPATITRRDYATAPDIDPTGGTDNFGLEVLAATGYARQALVLTVGVTYTASVRCYSPSANVLANAGRLSLDGSAWSAAINATVEDTWETLTHTQAAVTVGGRVNLFVRGATATDLAHFDRVRVYRQNAPALLRGWRSPAFTATMAHVSPAAAVTPFGFICRYTDPLNYWEIRVLPNTAGNDLQIIQVTAGVETVRAEADIDWTAGDTDELSVTAQGTTISTAHKKSGEAVWTAGPSYASATQGQTSPYLGVMLYETGVNRLASLRVVRA